MQYKLHRVDLRCSNPALELIGQTLKKNENMAAPLSGVHIYFDQLDARSTLGLILWFSAASHLLRFVDFNSVALIEI
jgi:hypothetical protein